MWKRFSFLLCILVFTAVPMYAGAAPPEIGEVVESSEYINKENIQAFSDVDGTHVYGVYNPYTGDGYFSGSITNEGSISAGFAANDANVYGIYSSLETDIIDSTIANSGDILAEWSLQDNGGDVWGGVSGLTVSHVEQSSITNSGNITSLARLHNIGGDTSVFIRGIQVSSAIGTLQDSSIFNSGSIETKVNIDGTDGLASGQLQGIYVDDVKNSSIENSGTITSSINLQDIGGYVSFAARGIAIDRMGKSISPKEIESSVSDSEVNRVSNAGNIDTTINIDGTQGNAWGTADGIFAGHAENSSIENTGSINSKAILNNIGGYADTWARGILIGGIRTLKESSILNSGSIEAATNIDGTQGDASASASGISSYTVVNSTIDNSGSISASANLNNIGGNDNELQILIVRSRGTETVGISASQVENSIITNSGSIEAATNIDGTQGDASASASGISSDTVVNSTIDNSGSINSTVKLQNIGGLATAMASGIHIGPSFYMPRLDTLLDSSIVNTGSINTNADLANIKGDAKASVMGIYVDDAVSESKKTTIDNQGTIDVSITTDNSANQTDFVAAGMMVENSGPDKIKVENQGKIKLDASELGEFEETTKIEIGFSSAKIASAVLLSSTIADFSNTGCIYTSANARALSLYDNSDVTLQNGFGYAFTGNPDDNRRPIHVDETSKLDLNGVPLVVDGTPDTVLDKPYYLIDQSGEVESAWGPLEKAYANQDITVDWYGNDRAENSAVIFNLEPKGNKSARAGMAARTAAYASQSQLSQYLLSGHVFGGKGFFADTQKHNKPVLLASAGTSDAFLLEASGESSKNAAYLLPYYGIINDEGLGADIDSNGFFLGYERKVGQFIAGVFGGYGRNEVDFNDTYKGNQEDQDGYTAGAYGIYNKKKWFGELYASYNEIEHDYSGRTGMNYELRETDEYDSRVFLTEAKAGIKFEDSGWGVYPSMGLRWTNWRTESHTSTVEANSDWNMRYDSLSEDWFQVFAGIDASKTWSLKGDANVSLTGGAGIKQDLNDNDIEMAQSLMGQSTVVEESVGSTSAVLNIAGAYTRDAFRAKLGVISEHNEDYDAYNGYLQVGFMW